MEKTKALAALSALSQESRLEIFRLLIATAPSGMAAGDIATRLDIPGPTLSHHLNLLRSAGLLTSIRQGRQIVYSADFDGMQGLIGFLTDQCCGGRPEICLPKPSAPDHG